MNVCPYCFSSDSSPVYVNAVLCRCGCVFCPVRHAANPYSAGAFTPNLETHRLMMNNLVSALPSQRWNRVLEIGAATGLLADAFQDRFGPSTYHAIEPAPDMADRLRRRPLHVIQETFDEVDPEGPFDLILCCNVDYLFADINRCMDKIHGALRPDGLLVIQRNVFVEQRGYVGQATPFSQLSEVFGPNPLISNWFMLAQYSELLARRFAIDSTSTDTTGIGFVNTYFCRRTERREAVPLMMRDQALEYLGSLGYQPLAVAS